MMLKTLDNVNIVKDKKYLCVDRRSGELMYDCEYITWVHSGYGYVFKCEDMHGYGHIVCADHWGWDRDNRYWILEYHTPSDVVVHLEAGSKENHILVSIKNEDGFLSSRKLYNEGLAYIEALT